MAVWLRHSATPPHILPPMAGLVVLLAIGYAVFLAALVGHTAWTLTHPHRKTYAWAVSRGRPGEPPELADDPRPFRAWTLKSRGVELPVWEIDGDGARAAPTVILTHGWGESRLHGLDRLPALVPVAGRIIAWDLPGHGEAPGICRLGASEAEHLLALIDTVRSADAGTPIVLMGSSLGAGLSIVAAARDARIAGVIAEAPYRVPISPARNVLRLYRLPWRANLPPALWALGAAFGAGPRWRGFDRALHAARLNCPLLVIHGELDGISPPEDGRAIAAAAPRAELALIDGAGHNDLWTDERLRAQCTAAVRGFIQSLAPAT